MKTTCVKVIDDEAAQDALDQYDTYAAKYGFEYVCVYFERRQRKKKRSINKG